MSVEIMTFIRGHKFIGGVARGVKQVFSAVKRGGKFLAKNNIKSLNDMDGVAAQVANGMQVAGQYAALGSHLAPGQYGTMLRDTGNSLTKGGETIQNVRNNHLAQRLKQDYGNRSIMN
jgi:hypothetical protein